MGSHLWLHAMYQRVVSGTISSSEDTVREASLVPAWKGRCEGQPRSRL